MRKVRDEAAFERLTAVVALVQDELAERLAPRPGERWLDLGGDGAVAVRAARAGATATVFGGPPDVVDAAREAVGDHGLGIRFDAGDPEYLPYDDASFDVLSSCFGFVEARDHANVAAELARVAAPGARLGFTAWRANPKLGELYRRFTDEPLDGREATEWGREDHVEDMLGDDFQLGFHEGTLWLEAGSGEELWELFSATATPVISLLGRLDAAGAEDFHRAFVELYDGYRDGDGIRAPRRYLITLGRRR